MPLLPRVLAFVVPSATIAVLAGACSTGGPSSRSSIDVVYIGNPNGVYRAHCDPVKERPAGNIVELRTGATVIDATNNYLPDGLNIIGPGSTSYADCGGYTVDTTARAPSTTSGPTSPPSETTVPAVPTTPPATP